VLNPRKSIKEVLLPYLNAMIYKPPSFINGKTRGGAIMAKKSTTKKSIPKKSITKKSAKNLLLFLT